MSGHRRVSQAYKSDISERVGPKKWAIFATRLTTVDVTRSLHEHAQSLDSAPLTLTPLVMVQ